MKPITKSGGEVRAIVRQVGTRKELIAKGGRLIAFYDEENDQTILSGGGSTGWETN